MHRWHLVLLVSGLSVTGSGYQYDDYGQPKYQNLRLQKVEEPAYIEHYIPGLDCDFQSSCNWTIHSGAQEERERTWPNEEAVNNSWNTLIPTNGKNLYKVLKFKKNSEPANKGTFLMYRAGFSPEEREGWNDKSNEDRSLRTGHSYLESPWILQSNPRCLLTFDAVLPDDALSKQHGIGTHPFEHASMDVGLYQFRHYSNYRVSGVIPIKPQKFYRTESFSRRQKSHRRETWWSFEYPIQRYQKFKIEISLVKGKTEAHNSFFAIDNVKLKYCLPTNGTIEELCDDTSEFRCPSTGECISRFKDFCDFENDCPGGEDEEQKMCQDAAALEPKSQCNFVAADLCQWSLLGPMKWSRINDTAPDNALYKDGVDGLRSHTPILNLDIGKYQNQKLVTLGILRSQLLTPPPPYHSEKNSPYFQSCHIRMFLKVTHTKKSDFFEIEVLEQTPFSKVARGNTVKKIRSIKMKDFAHENIDVVDGPKWVKLDAVIPTNMKYKFFFQINSVKGADYTVDGGYNMSVANISLSPQCLGLGVPDNMTKGSCWDWDMSAKELADCMDVPYPEENMDNGVFSYSFTTCTYNTGPNGPWKEDCLYYYDYNGGNATKVDMYSYREYEREKKGWQAAQATNNQSDAAQFHNNRPIQYGMGVQRWKVPRDGVYTIIAKGASGGHGRLSRMSSHGAVITAIINLKKDEELCIVVGQEGESACVIEGVESRDGLCAPNNDQHNEGYEADEEAIKWQVRHKREAGTTGRRMVQQRPAARGKQGEVQQRPAAGGKQGEVQQRPAAGGKQGVVQQQPEAGGKQVVGQQRQAAGDKQVDPIRQINGMISISKFQEKMQADDGNMGAMYPEDQDMADYEKGREVNTVEDESKPSNTWLEDIKDYTPSYQSGGGGGGGATFIFKIYSKEGSNETYAVPLLVAGGGGGRADFMGQNDPDATKLFDPTKHNPKTILEEFAKQENLNPQVDLSDQTEKLSKHGGHGGGWNTSLSIHNVTYFEEMQRSTSSGFTTDTVEKLSGGWPCNLKLSEFTLDSPDTSVAGSTDVYTARWGGFGGGGGGCNGGGGGGGFIGGAGGVNGSENGYGGWSYIDRTLVVFASETVGKNTGPGEVLIIPDIGGNKNQTQCKCHDDDSKCVALDEKVSNVNCYCKGGTLVDVNIPCTREMPTIFVLIIVIGSIVISAIIGLICMCIYTQYQRKRMGLIRSKMMRGADTQLNRLRNSNGIMMTEYNPNYEFGGGSCTLQDLKELPRENLRLIKALGQGAFGEVYQGFFKKAAGDAVEMPVAVKTLPELSSSQGPHDPQWKFNLAEMDFLMEALIMSKFKHANIVHFIGVCFEKHPRFIVLELLAGGDLKTFLRESRPKPEKPSSLVMRDLMNAAIDVAKGCQYLEDNHFIHRDIAARNCLLTTKGLGRTVKIADFGMARDIYRADYYRKGGKAMLPVKWMPPEAFLDGIFTSKTDVWSFGILLWEVMSLGYMPYPGRGNQEVMQLVTNGGRLEPPNYCPGPLYGLMCQCWHPIPEERPNFKTIMERLGYCLQDPEVVMAPLPVFHRPQSLDSRDTSLSSSGRIGPGDSSGNSGSGGSVNIGKQHHQHHGPGHHPTQRPPPQPPTPASDYLVPDMSTSHSNLDSSPSLDSGLASGGGRICDNETSFTNSGRWSRPGCSRSGYSSIPNGSGYSSIPDVSMSHGVGGGVPSSVPLSQASSVSSSPPLSSHPPPPDHDCVRESKSTEPLLADPDNRAENVSPPRRVDSVSPPRQYTDSVTLDPGQLGAARPTSYVNVGVNDHLHHADVFTLHNRRQEPQRRQDPSKQCPGTEISV